MTIFDYKENYWIAAWELYNPHVRYNSDYDKRPDDYFDPRIPAKRMENIQIYTSIYECFDYGCGKRPLNGTLGRYDKYVPEYTILDYNKFKNSKMILLFDVIEHIYDVNAFISLLPQSYVYITVPTVPLKEFNSLEQIQSWKHYKPGEHVWYCTEQGWINIFENSGWDVVYYNNDECPPRTDITTFILHR